MTINFSLRKVLRSNAAFSGFSGLSLSLFPYSIAHWMGATFPDILRYIGIGLVLFSLALWIVSSQKTISKKATRFIILQDWLWVLVSLLILVFQWFGLETSAYSLIGGVAIVVGGFAVLQGRKIGG